MVRPSACSMICLEAWRRATDGREWSGYGDPDTEDLDFDDLRRPRRPRRAEQREPRRE